MEHRFTCHGAQEKKCSLKGNHTISEESQFSELKKLQNSRVTGRTLSRVRGAGEYHCLCSLHTSVVWMGAGSGCMHQLQDNQDGFLAPTHVQMCLSKIQESHQGGNSTVLMRIHLPHAPSYPSQHISTALSSTQLDSPQPPVPHPSPTTSSALEHHPPRKPPKHALLSLAAPPVCPWTVPTQTMS